MRIIDLQIETPIKVIVLWIHDSYATISTLSDGWDVIRDVSFRKINRVKPTNVCTLQRFKRGVVEYLEAEREGTKREGYHTTTEEETRRQR